MLEPSSSPVTVEARPTQSPDELEVVRRACAGEAGAFETIVRDHADAVWRIVAGHVGRDEAEDASQEVFVRVHGSLKKFRGDCALRTWIFRIATNVALTRLRRRARRRSREEVLGAEAVVASTAPGPDDELATRERVEALHRALAQLPEHQRAVVILRGFEGLSFEEVAAVLGIRRPTAESRMARAKDRLRELLGDLIR